MAGGITDAARPCGSKIDLEDLSRRVASALDLPGVELEGVAAGASRAGYAVVGSEREPVAFLRVDDGASGLSGTKFNLAREARVLAKVRARGLPVPEVLAVLEGPPALLLEYVAGTSTPDAAHRDAVARQYMQVLARIHQLPPEIQGDQVPSTTQDAVAEDLGWWARYANDAGVETRPVIDFAVGALDTFLPRVSASPRFLHGDAGPGNLLADADRLVAVLDWEMAHAGDPHEDLAWILIRTVHTPFGDLALRFREYVEAGGVTVHPERLRWHIGFVLTKTAIALAVSLDRADGRLAALHHTLWLVYATLLVDVLRELSSSTPLSNTTLTSFAEQLDRGVQSDERARRMVERARGTALLDPSAR